MVVTSAWWALVNASEPVPAVDEAPDSEVPDSEVPDEEMVVIGARRARELLDGTLEDLGYRHQKSRGPKTIYRSRDYWQPVVVVYEEGFILTRTPWLALERWRYNGLSGRFSSRGVDESMETRLWNEIGDDVATWQAALQSEGGLAVVPKRTVMDGIEQATSVLYGDRLPLDLGPPTRGDVACEEQNVIDRLHLAPELRSALMAVSRQALSAHDASEASFADLRGTDLASIPMAALALQAAELGPGVRLLDATTDRGYLSAVALALGATVTVLREDEQSASAVEARLRPHGVVEVCVGPVTEGCLRASPFDAVWVGEAFEVDAASFSQLDPGGVVLRLDPASVTVFRRDGEAVASRRIWVEWSTLEQRTPPKDLATALADPKIAPCSQLLHTPAGMDSVVPADPRPAD